MMIVLLLAVLGSVSGLGVVKVELQRHHHVHFQPQQVHLSISGIKYQVGWRKYGTLA